MAAPNFPHYEDSSAKDKIADLVRLMDVEMASTQYVHAKEAAKLVATLVQSYKNSLDDLRWTEDAVLLRSTASHRRFHLALAAIFDLVCNIEYYHGRLQNTKWIYCSRQDKPSVRAFYSALKQCPCCCLDKGLEPRLAGAQHKPSSHHIGEITTTVCALLLKLIAAAAESPLTIAAILKQSHNVDAIGFNADTLVLFEMKASPLVTFPLAAEITPLYTANKDGDQTEYRQHSLIDQPTDGRELFLYIPHRDWTIPLKSNDSASWPYSAAQNFFDGPENFLEYLSAWLELYYAYSVPKTTRSPEIQSLTYLVNGWGDEIDSNKTKPGLGRTDDIKKGTYQLLKFGAYYRDVTASVRLRSALVSNVDPLFLKAEYIDKLLDVRWARQQDFVEAAAEYRIQPQNLHYLYEAILAFNEPVINDPLLRQLFDFDHAEQSLISGYLDTLLNKWLRSSEVIDDVAVF